MIMLEPTKEQLAARIAGASGAPVTTPAETTPTKADFFLDSIQSKVLDQMGIVSSAPTKLQSLLSDAAESVKTANEASKKSLSLDYGERIAKAKEAATGAVTSAQEAQRGFATNTALISKIVKDGQDSINALEKQKESLLLQGDAAAASKIADLQVKQAESMVTAQQQTFSNLLQLANFGLQRGESERANRSLALQETSFNWTQKKDMADLATRYGVRTYPGETMESLIDRVQPLASQEEALKLQKMRLESQEIQVRTNKMLKDSVSGSLDITDPYSLKAAANLLRTVGFDALKGLDWGDAVKVSEEARGMQLEDFRSIAKQNAASGVSIDETLNQLASGSYGTLMSDPIAIQKAVEEEYKKVPRQKSLIERLSGGAEQEEAARVTAEKLRQSVKNRGITRTLLGI